MRGPPSEILKARSVKRITPAYAGTTYLGRDVAVSCRDHPRLCGDHPAYALNSCSIAGSPPLMRGPPVQYDDMGPKAGITPAYAGTTVDTETTGLKGWDHPRLCGDHIGHYVECIHPIGSPPLMRGPRVHAIVVDILGGITPAYAGTTSTRAVAGRCSGDHPRLCGDHG